jgi:hypothetical protein
MFNLFSREVKLPGLCRFGKWRRLKTQDSAAKEPYTSFNSFSILTFLIEFVNLGWVYCYTDIIMRLFGLLSIVITAAFIVWWFADLYPQRLSETGENQPSYEESIEAAEAAAELLGAE